MRNKIIIIACAFLLPQLLFSQLQVTTTLITSQHVKQAEFLQLSIANEEETVYNFLYNNFSKNGYYANTNLYQHNADINWGAYLLKLTLKTANEITVTDSLIVDSSISRVEIFVFISTDSVPGDYIREVKMILYNNHSDLIKITPLNKYTVGSEAVFNIKNTGNKDLYPYPDNTAFFGTLYQQLRSDGWVQYYPLAIDTWFCKTTAPSIVFKTNEELNAWTPNKEDCSKFIFRESGHFYFELLYSTSEYPKTTLKGITTIRKADVYRQAIKFEVE